MTRVPGVVLKARVFDTTSGTCFAPSRFSWSPPLAPPAPQLWYTVVREPTKEDLPAFLGSFRPDAIATGKQLPSLLIEVITRRGSGPTAAAKVEQLRSLLIGHPDWKLEVVYTPSSLFPSVAPVGTIRNRYVDIRRLSETDRPAALIMTWSLLEAVARATFPDRAARGLTPGSIVELLTSLGYIVQSEAETLRDAGRSRNLIAHGDVTIDVPPVELKKVLDILDALIDHLERNQPGAA